MLRGKLKRYFHYLLALGAYWYYGRPSRKMIVVGVTGTKGKSTTCRLVASVLEAGGYKVGMLTTVEFQIGTRRFKNDKKMTMLGLGQIHKMLKEMVKAGCSHVVVETSSEGILQFRHLGLNYDIAVFTNLGTEHSERHGGVDKLKRDKGKMFSALMTHRKTLNGKNIPKIIIANADDDNASYYLSYKADKKFALTFKGVEEGQVPQNTEVFTAIKGAQREKGASFILDGKKYYLNILGDFNNYNALAAVVVGLTQGITSDQIDKGLESVGVVEGRMEFVEEGQPFKVVVDYAHEPMSLTALFTTLRELVKKNNGKVIAVIGSDGGGRDVQKRRTMGEVSAKLADCVIITDVNCFDEDPAMIAEMLAVGAREAGARDNNNLYIVVDRKEAIRKAFALSGPNDVVAITAKGTEPYICVAGGKKIPWDDRMVARELLSENYVAQK